MTREQEIAACSRVLLETAYGLDEGLEPTRKRALQLVCRVERGDLALAPEALDAVANAFAGLADAYRRGDIA